jgi:ubiquinone biosynthesis protein
VPSAGFIRTLTRPLVRRGTGRPGERLARALREAGPAFIKLGQALSTRSDLLGEDLTADLSDLQDRLPPFPGSEARAIIAAEFGRPVEHLFAEFNDTPVAAASIAQVHFAVDTAGRPVAVKVLRPGVEDDFRRHLDLFAWAAELIEARLPQWRRLRPRESIRILAESVRIEMDLRFEAAAAAELSDNFADDPSFRVPAVDWTRTGQRVLTLERVAGISLDERYAIVAAGHDPQHILSVAADAFFRQVFRDGFFHADLHPGNLFVEADGRVVVVDFGIMGRLDVTNRRHLAELLLAFLSRDYRRAAEVHFRAGWVPRDRSIASFAQACRSIAEPILDKPQNEISIARLLGQLFHVTETFGMETQPQLLLLQKTMLVAEGTGRRLAPEANMWWLARPLAEEWMSEAMHPEVRLREAVGDLVDTVRRAPEVVHLVEQGAAVLARGQVRLHPESAHVLRSGGAGSIGRWLPWLLLSAALGGWLF